MPKYAQEDEQISDGVNLLISILVRYPEIGTISFDHRTDLITLTFMLSGIPAQSEFTATRQIILDSIDAYHLLEGQAVMLADVKLSSFEQVAILNILRDVHTLSKSEIALIITLLREKFGERLVTDFNDSMPEEDLIMQEELIENMLESMKKQHIKNGLIGIREDGRVLVFNK
jgi:archaellum biogenesis ATPase FlaH